MEVNVFEMIEDDKFFIGSYPNNFSVGRWFSVKELIGTSYGDIEAEYLRKYNPNGLEELELGVFDVDNYSELWKGEYGVPELIKTLNDIATEEYYEVNYLEIYEFTDTIFDDLGMSAFEAVRAVYFGKITSWLDPYIGIDGNGNFRSFSQLEYDKEIKNAVSELNIF
jgi:hypothetical protein